MTMGELIRYHRKRLKLSQEELGKCLQPPVNKAAINKWETGAVENIKRTHIQQLAKKFNMSPCDLMCWEDENDISKQITEATERKLISVLMELNNTGKEEVLKFADYIASQDKYKKT